MLAYHEPPESVIIKQWTGVLRFTLFGSYPSPLVLPKLTVKIKRAAK
nr:MAG TPA: hypothetical protein [Caudoviricetes sp.]